MGELYRLTPDESPESVRADLHDAGLDVALERHPSNVETKDRLCRHLWDHGVLLTSREFWELSVEDMDALDPCSGDAA